MIFSGISPSLALLPIPIIMIADSIKVERVTTDPRIFAFSRWDALPALAGLFHLAFFFSLFFLYPHTPLWITLALGFIYSLMVNARGA